MGPPVFSWSVGPKLQKHGHQDSSLGLSGCPPQRGRGSRKSRGAVGAVGESAKSQSQRQDEVHHPSSCSRPALASVASRGCSTHLRCRGNLSSVRTRPEDRLWRRDLPFQLPPVAMQTGPHLPVDWPLVFSSILRTAHPIHLPSQPFPGAWGRFCPQRNWENSSLGVQGASPPRDFPPALTPSLLSQEGGPLPRATAKFQVLGDGAEFGREGAQLPLKKMGGRKCGCS